MTEPEHHPFDPDVLKRVAAAVGIARSAGSDFATPRTADLAQLLERDAYAEQTRLQLAEKCATYRSQRDTFHTDLANATGILRRLVEHDTDPCDFDHDGLCQTHSLHSQPCPVASARRFINLMTLRHEEG